MLIRWKCARVGHKSDIVTPVRAKVVGAYWMRKSGEVGEPDLTGVYPPERRGGTPLLAQGTFTQQPPSSCASRASVRVSLGSA
jgi:hypothetical protein